MARPARREHVAGQQRRQILAQAVGGDIAVRRRGVSAADLPSFEAFGLNRDYRALPKARERVKRRLDLAQLDPVASALDLRIGAAQEVEQTVGPTTRQIAGLVNAIVSRPVGIRKKHAAGLVRVAPVPRAQAHAADVEVAYIPLGNGPQLFVEDQQLLAVASAADRNRL